MSKNNIRVVAGTRGHVRHHCRMVLAPGYVLLGEKRPSVTQTLHREHSQRIFCLCDAHVMIQVSLGSMWFQEAEDPSDATPKEKFLIKWQGMSYLHVSWETAEDLIDQVGTVVIRQVRSGE